jgi:hypothetical protein
VSYDELELDIEIRETATRRRRSRIESQRAGAADERAYAQQLGRTRERASREREAARLRARKSAQRRQQLVRRFLRWANLNHVPHDRRIRIGLAYVRAWSFGRMTIGGESPCNCAGECCSGSNSWTRNIPVYLTSRGEFVGFNDDEYNGERLYRGITISIDQIADRIASKSALYGVRWG